METATKSSETAEKQPLKTLKEGKYKKGTDAQT